MPDLSLPFSVCSNLGWAILGSLIIVPIFLALTHSIKAPYLAFRLLRRNRPLGRDIYREIAQADRFMEIWSSNQPLLSDDRRNIYALTGESWDRQAGYNSRIDDQLAKLKLIERFQDPQSAGAQFLVKPAHGKYWLRNWLVFLFLLFLRMTFLGDKASHISIGGGRFTVKDLNRLYWITIFLIFAIIAMIFTLFNVSCS